MELQGFWEHVVNIVPLSIVAMLFALKLWSTWLKGDIGFITAAAMSIMVSTAFEPWVQKRNLAALAQLGGWTYIGLVVTNLILWALGVTIIVLIWLGLQQWWNDRRASSTRITI